MVHMLKTGLKIATILMVFFSTIAPVYANANIPPLKNFFSQSQQVAYADHTMPCHGALEKVAAKKNMQELCFQHCLQYLNEPCVIPSKSDLSVEKAQQSPSKSMIVDMLQTPGLQFEVISLTDPPSGSIWNKSTKGIPSILHQTSRLRN